MNVELETNTPTMAVVHSHKETRKPTSALQKSPHKKRQMMLAGGFALCAALLLLVTPELGLLGAIGTLGMGAASAITTILAKQ